MTIKSDKLAFDKKKYRDKQTADFMSGNKSKGEWRGTTFVGGEELSRRRDAKRASDLSRQTHKQDLEKTALLNKGNLNVEDRSQTGQTKRKGLGLEFDREKFTEETSRYNQLQKDIKGKSLLDRITSGMKPKVDEFGNEVPDSGLPRKSVMENITNEDRYIRESQGGETTDEGLNRFYKDNPHLTDLRNKSVQPATATDNPETIQTAQNRNNFTPVNHIPESMTPKDESYKDISIPSRHREKKAFGQETIESNLGSVLGLKNLSRANETLINAPLRETWKGLKYLNKKATQGIDRSINWLGRPAK